MNAIFTVSISHAKNNQMYKCSLETIKYYSKKIYVFLSSLITWVRCICNSSCPV